ncbi:MAG: branched-chain amino acid aminotransferase [Microgenomates group bacterium Gr01-1014_16]|nr:MAG: branched-chain amino acid aminotransferase [Microgenomates group bacterium Gr01-1014_16]
MSKSEDFKFAFFQGKIVPQEKARVSIKTNALQYGTAVFGGIRGYYDKDKRILDIFRPQDHFERFLNSLKILGVSIPYSSPDLVQIIVNLVIKNHPRQNVYFRPFAYAGSLQLAPNLFRDNKFDFAMYMIPLEEYLSVSKGLSVKVSSWTRVSDNSIPARGKISGSYINSALARQESAQLGFDEAIVLNNKGEVSEGSAENLFIVRNGYLVTPPVTEDILEGITRNTILQLAKDLNILTVERSIDRSELYIADEAFFCGTGVQVAWISEIDKRPVGNSQIGPITSRIQTAFFSLVHGKMKKYSSWVYPIKLK